MRITNRYIMKLGGLAITAVTRQWMSTLKYQAVFYDRAVDPASPSFQGPGDLSVLARVHPVSVLLARALPHRDAAEPTSGCGVVVAGGGAHGVRDDSRIDQSRGHVGAARTDADGRDDEPDDHARTVRAGPRRQLGGRLHLRLVAFGDSAGADRPGVRSLRGGVRRAWDQFAVPRPYSRARAVAGPKVQIPAGVSRDGVEHYRQRVEHLLNALTTLAEQWAESGAAWWTAARLATGAPAGRGVGELPTTPSSRQPQPTRSPIRADVLRMSDSGRTENAMGRGSRPAGE